MHHEFHQHEKLYNRSNIKLLANNHHFYYSSVKAEAKISGSKLINFLKFNIVPSFLRYLLIFNSVFAFQRLSKSFLLSLEKRQMLHSSQED